MIDHDRSTAQISPISPTLPSGKQTTIAIEHGPVEIVFRFPMKKTGDFPVRNLLVYQRVTPQKTTWSQSATALVPSRAKYLVCPVNSDFSKHGIPGPDWLRTIGNDMCIQIYIYISRHNTHTHIYIYIYNYVYRIVYIYIFCILNIYFSSS